MGTNTSVMAPERIFTDQGMSQPWSGRKRCLAISIDVGATQSAVALGLLEPGQTPDSQQVSHWHGQESKVFDVRVPSVLAYDEKGKFLAAGAEATQFRKNSSFVQYFKLILHQEATTLKNIEDLLPDDAPELPRNVSISAVYRDYLHYLMDHVRERLNDILDPSSRKEFLANTKLILTHPNQWQGDMQAFLRNAAVDAGLISRARSKESVYFVEEAEAAARFCISKYTEFGVLQPGKRIMICDAGGSTVDITLYDVNFGQQEGVVLEEVTTSCVGGGGIFVDLAMEKFLRSVLARAASLPVDDTIEDIVTNSVADFEALAKRRFKTRSDTGWVQVGDNDWTDSSLGIRRGSLGIPGAVVEDQIFGPTVQRVLERVQKILTASDKPIEWLILTGGFGESRYLQRKFSDQFGSQVQSILSPDGRSNVKPVPVGALQLMIGSGRIRLKRRNRPSLAWLTA